MASQAIQDLAAKRLASGASTKNTALPTVAPTPSTSSALGQVTPLPKLSTSTTTPAKNNSALPPVSPTATPQQQALAKASTQNGLSPREAFTSDQAYQNYLKRASGQGPTYTPETNPDAFPLVQVQAPVNSVQSTTAQPISQPAQTTKPTDSAQIPSITPQNVTSDADQIKADSQTALDEAKKLQDANIAGESDYRDALTQSATDRYNAEQANLARLELLQGTALEARNKALDMGADIQRRDAEIAYNKAKAEYDLQRKRTEQAYNDQIVEQKLNNTKRTLQEESTLAALGGFGSRTKNKEVQDLTLQNDRLINNLVFQKDTADQEISVQIQGVTDNYYQNLNKIETQKQAAVQENYNKYLEYVTKIQDDREMSEVEKENAINEAAASYKKNVAQINQTSFDQRYEISQTAAVQARQVQAQQKDDARTILKDVLTTFAQSDAELTPEQQTQLQTLEQKAGYPIDIALQQLQNLKKQAQAENLQIQTTTDNAGNVTVVGVDKTTGEVKAQTTLQGIAASTKYTLQFNPVTGETSVFDPSTGQVIAGGSTSVAQNYMSNTPAGYQSAGNNLVPNADFDKIFGVGEKGGQCGHYANNISTGKKVGDSWASKIGVADIRPDAQGNLNRIPDVGDKLVIPLGVKTDSDWGHVAVVTNFDPSSGTISVVESNIHGDEIVTKGTYNLDQLKQKFGTNFGFVSGELRPQYQNALQKSTVPYPISSSTGGQGGQKDFQAYVQEAQAGGMPLKQAYDYASKRIDEQSKAPTEAQANAETFATRIADANNIFDQLESQGINFSDSKYIAERAVPDSLFGFSLGGAGKSPELKQQEQAERNFVNAVLRRESGSAISSSEFESAAKQYFPQPGDTPAVLAQKKRNRQVALQGLQIGAGPAAGKLAPQPSMQIPDQSSHPDPLGLGVSGEHKDPLGIL